MGLHLKLLVKPAQVLRTLVFTKSTTLSKKPINLYCGKRIYFVAKHNYIGNPVRLYSTTPNVSKKKLVLRMPEIRRLIALARPEKWKLFGKNMLFIAKKHFKFKETNLFINFSCFTLCKQ